MSYVCAPLQGTCGACAVRLSSCEQGTCIHLSSDVDSVRKAQDAITAGLYHSVLCSEKSTFQALVLALTPRECNTTVETGPVPFKNRMTHACTNTCVDPSEVSVRSDIRVAPAAMLACTRETQSVHWYSRSQTAKQKKLIVLTTTLPQTRAAECTTPAVLLEPFTAAGCLLCCQSWSAHRGT